MSGYSTLSRCFCKALFPSLRRAPCHRLITLHHPGARDCCLKVIFADISNAITERVSPSLHAGECRSAEYEAFAPPFDHHADREVLHFVTSAAHSVQTVLPSFVWSI